MKYHLHVLQGPVTVLVLNTFTFLSYPILHPPSYIQHPTSSIFIRHPTSSILHPASYIQHLHQASYIQHPTSSILHPTSYIQHPTSSILHPASYILSYSKKCKSLQFKDCINSCIVYKCAFHPCSGQTWI